MTCEGPPLSDKDRLARLLGPLVRLVDAPALALLVAVPCWLVLAILSGRWLAAALCCWSVVLLAVALWLERPWLDRLPFPPVTVLTLVGVMRWGLGAALLALAGPDLQPDVAPWSRALEPSQALWALVSTGIVLAALLNRPLLSRLRPGPLAASVRRRIGMLTLLLGLFSLGYVLVGVISGTLDRSGGNYVYWVTRLWRADTAFVPFIRLKDLFFLLVPITVQIALQPAPNGSPSRLRWLAPVLLALATASLGLGALTGGRGLLLAPLVLLIAGLWMTDIRASLLRWLAVGVLIVALVFIPLMASLRQTTAFQNSSIQHLDQRAGVIARAAAEAHPNHDNLALIGRDLFPSSDPYLFQPPGSLQAAAGWRGLDGLLFLWIPKHLYPQRPEINDGHLIAKEIMGTPEMGTVGGIHIWFPNVSFGGDLYRRFRWPGVILGSTVFGLFYALVSRIWYRVASLSHGFYRFLIAIYPATFFNGVPLRSVSVTVWNWFWDFPKYLLVLLALSWLVERLYRLLPQPSQAAHTSVVVQPDS